MNNGKLTMANVRPNRERVPGTKMERQKNQQQAVLLPFSTLCRPVIWPGFGACNHLCSPFSANSCVFSRNGDWRVRLLETVATMPDRHNREKGLRLAQCWTDEKRSDLVKPIPQDWLSCAAASNLCKCFIMKLLRKVWCNPVKAGQTGSK